MRVRIGNTWSEDLTRYLEVLEKYNVEDFKQERLGSVYSYITLNSIEDIFNLQKELEQLSKRNKWKHVAEIIVLDNEEEPKIEIYDNWRE